MLKCVQSHRRNAEDVLEKFKGMRNHIGWWDQKNIWFQEELGTKAKASSLGGLKGAEKNKRVSRQMTEYVHKFGGRK